jgi:uncharacterized protein YwgA
MEQLSYSYRCAVIVDLANKLRSEGSWCGETHLQKSIYILQDLMRANFGYKFVIYKHGPFSFDLKNEIAALLASKLLELKFPREGYGPSIVATNFGERVLELHREGIEKFSKMNEFIARWFSKNDVKYLEKVATAYFVASKHPREPLDILAQRINSMKPHVDIEAALEALKIVGEKRGEAQRAVAA